MALAELYTSDKELQNLIDGDPAADVVGYIVDVEMQNAGQNRTFLKIILSNGNLKIHCMIWGDDLIQKYLPDLLANRVVHIQGGRVKSVWNPQWSNRDCNHDIIITNHSVLNFLGNHA